MYQLPVGVRLEMDDKAHQKIRYLTLKSFPDDFKLAQSRGLCPGVRATFARFLPGFFVVVVGGASEETAEEGTASEEDNDEVPGCRFARPGSGGGGIN